MEENLKRRLQKKAEIKKIEEETIEETKLQSGESITTTNDNNNNEEVVRLIEKKLNTLTLRFDQHISTNHTVINDIHEQLIIVKKMIKEQEEQQKNKEREQEQLPPSPPVLTRTCRKTCNT